MNEFTNTLKKMNEIKMTPEERRRVWASINTSISSPIFNTALVRKENPRRPYNGGSVSTPRASYFTIEWAKWAKKYSYIFIIIFLAGGAIPLFAESSLPGDALYSVKINVNEKFRGFIALTNKRKADLEMNLAFLRLDEAKSLAKSGRFNQDIKKETESSFEGHALNFETHLFSLEEEGKLDLVIETSKKFENKIDEYEKSLIEMNHILNPVNSEKISVDSDLSALTSTLPLHKENSSLIRKSAEKELEKHSNKK